MEIFARLVGFAIFLAFWHFVFWPTIGRIWRGLRDMYRDPTFSDVVDGKAGFVHTSRSVNPELSKIASEAISTNRYVVRSAHGGKAILVLKTRPLPLVAVITRVESLMGGAPDVIIDAVYNPSPRSAEDFADDVAELVH